MDSQLVGETAIHCVVGRAGSGHYRPHSVYRLRTGNYPDGTIHVFVARYAGVEQAVIIKAANIGKEAVQNGRTK